MKTGFIYNPELLNQLQQLKKNTQDLRQEMHCLRQLSHAQSTALNDAVKDTITMLKKAFLINSDVITASLSDNPSAIEICVTKVHHLKENYQLELKHVDNDLK